ncbi:MAG: hypothetical protein EP326_05545 [Deltaproteobacteria bacterium]|nr:MAG: hypothetical protein EP326_05545 [Deltaproteobacteria bacterium]TNF25727.1 MAG: hypothetical protein EP319_15600 [Deltaproteobacteria bacterium]
MNDHLQKEWEEFKSNESKDIPKHLDLDVQHYVSELLNPPKHVLFGKLALVQSFIGTLTLLFCPQFKFSLTANDALYHYFHYTFGHYGCMVACGALFLGSGMIFAGFLLNDDEIRAIRKSRTLFISAISGASLTIFMLIGAEVYLDMALYWIFGTLIGGLLSFETSSLLKIKALKFF